MAAKLWGGRFTEGPSALMERFNNSLDVDKRMWLEDITGSQAYAQALARAKIITDEEATQLCNGLQKVAEEWRNGTFVIQPSDEDIHTANERRLTELVGPVGGKLHTGRSRNDQVVTDVRLWMRNEITTQLTFINEFITKTVDRAEREIDAIMPGYTHLQVAQPVRWSHWLLSHAWAVRRDAERMMDLRKRVNLLPLGSGALAGHALGLDRAALARDLGFDAPTGNSMDAVADRDFMAEFQFCCSMLATHLSRWAEDLIIFSSREFGFVQISESFSTGSSLMPQKRNPDACELVRGKTGRVIGALVGLLVTIKGLPSTYNKDMQEDKAPLFDTADTTASVLQIASGVVESLRINADRMRAALGPEMLATDLAEYLVRKGVPFRETHHISGAAVRMAESRNVPLSSLTLEDLLTLHPAFTADVSSVWDFERSVETRSSAGGTSRKAVEEQITQLRAFLAQ